MPWKLNKETQASIRLHPSSHLKFPDGRNTVPLTRTKRRPIQGVPAYKLRKKRKDLTSHTIYPPSFDHLFHFLWNRAIQTGRSLHFQYQTIVTSCHQPVITRLQINEKPMMTDRTQSRWWKITTCPLPKWWKLLASISYIIIPRFTSIASP